jgi:hypothetical protein
MKIENLSAHDLKYIRRERFVIISIIAAFFVVAALIPIICFGFSEYPGEKERTIVFALTPVFLGGGIILIFIDYLVYETWKNLKAKTKYIVCGKVMSKKIEITAGGKLATISTRIVLDSGYSAEEPMFTVPDGFMEKAKVGDTVEIAYIGNSSRALSVTLKSK